MLPGNELRRPCGEPSRETLGDGSPSFVSKESPDPSEERLNDGDGSFDEDSIDENAATLEERDARRPAGEAEGSGVALNDDGAALEESRLSDEAGEPCAARGEASAIRSRPRSVGSAFDEVSFRRVRIGVKKR